MRFLVFSCLHVHPFRPFATYAEGNSRRKEILGRWREIVERANQPDIDVLLCAGDFFHEKLYIDVVSASEVLRISDGLEKPMVMCSGTHDRVLSGHSSLEIFRDHSRKWFVDEPADFDFSSPEGRGYRVRFHAVPHMQSAEEQDRAIREQDFIKQRTILDRGKRVYPFDILLTHGDVSGFEYGSEAVQGINLLAAESLYCFMIVGHLHNAPEVVPAQVVHDRNKVLFAGACIPHSFGDEKIGTVYIVDVSSQGIYVGELVFPNPRFVTLEVDAETLRGMRSLSLDCYYRFIVPSAALEKDLRSSADSLGLRYIIKERTRPAGGEARVDSLVDTVMEPHRLLSDFVNSRTTELNKGKLLALGRVLLEAFQPAGTVDEIEEILS